MFKKFLVLVLTIVILLSAVPIPVGAAVKGTMYYTALGDSIGAGTDNRSLLIGYSYKYVNQFYNYLKSVNTDKNVVLSNLSVPGDKSSDLLNKLKNNSTFRSNVAKSQVITISIGGNDVLNAGASSGYETIDDTAAYAGIVQLDNDIGAIISAISQLNTGAKILVMNLYNPYNPYEYGYKSANGTKTYVNLHELVAGYLSAFDSVLDGIALVNKQVKVVDTYSEFEKAGRFSNVKTIKDAYGKDVILCPHKAGTKTTCTDGYTNFYSYPYKPINIPYFRDPHPSQGGHNAIYSAHVSAYKN